MFRRAQFSQFVADESHQLSTWPAETVAMRGRFALLACFTLLLLVTQSTSTFFFIPAFAQHCSSPSGVPPRAIMQLFSTLLSHYTHFLFHWRHSHTSTSHFHSSDRLPTPSILSSNARARLVRTVLGVIALPEFKIHDLTRMTTINLIFSYPLLLQ